MTLSFLLPDTAVTPGCGSTLPGVWVFLSIWHEGELEDSDDLPLSLHIFASFLTDETDDPYILIYTTRLCVYR